VLDAIDLDLWQEKFSVAKSECRLRGLPYFFKVLR
jgi:hypothetical protein